MNTQAFPSAPEAEASLLSTIIQIPSGLFNCMSLLSSESFYVPKHRNLWDLIIHLHNERKPFDLVAICQGLTDREQIEQFGGFSGMIEFTSKFFNCDVTGASKIIHSKFIRRQAIIESHKLIKKALDQNCNIENEIAKSQNMLNEGITTTTSKERTAHDVSMDIAREISDNLGKYKEVTGVPTGFESYDKRISGLSDEGDLIILAARPSMGKTTFALNVAHNAQKVFGYNGVFFSLEMSETQICRILIAKETGVSASDLKKNKVSDLQIEHIFNTLSEKCASKLFIDDVSPQLTYIISRIHKLKRDHDIKYVIIDYLQLMSCESKNNRALEVEFISRSLKGVAQALKIPIVALCQLSRAVETRGGSKRPELSDLRDSGSIEQDASVVSFLWRPEYYGILEDESGISLAGATMIITKKNRFGEIGEDCLFFDMGLSEFQDYNYKTGHKIPVENYDMRLVTMQDLNKPYISNFTEKMNNEKENTETPFDTSLF